MFGASVLDAGKLEIGAAQIPTHHGGHFVLFS
jgi:hypothetical protein